MPTYDDLMDQLTKAGVRVIGRDTLDKMCNVSKEWSAVFVEAAIKGGKNGVILVRAGACEPSDNDLNAILRGYFDDTTARLVMQNISANHYHDELTERAGND